jgi:hypothetical protein
VKDLCNVQVPTEDGRMVAIDFYRHRDGFWTVDISDELVLIAPEGLTAALLLGFREIRERVA